MAQMIEVLLPDIGDFHDVEVIEILVKAGDRIEAEDPLITLESDKASMEIPAPQAGVVGDVRVALGDKINQGDLLLTLEPVSAEQGGEAPGDEPEPPAEPAGAEQPGTDDAPVAQHDEAFEEDGHPQQRGSGGAGRLLLLAGL